ncbi:hypothetical protein KY289_013781 [Solanum tuberosum]|nr:hypothetical protein KY289_013781 [Solanum tuberosum]
MFVEGNSLLGSSSGSSNSSGGRSFRTNYSPLNASGSGKGMAANSVSLSCDASGGQDDNSDSQFDASGNNNINLTKEQYGQATHLLKQFQSCSTMEDQNDMQMTCACGAVNFAGILTYSSSIDFEKLSCECFKARTDLWILDSGGSHNMTFDKDHLAPLMKRPLKIGKAHDQFQF